MSGLPSLDSVDPAFYQPQKAETVSKARVGDNWPTFPRDVPLWPCPVCGRYTESMSAHEVTPGLCRPMFHAEGSEVRAS